MANWLGQLLANQPLWLIIVVASIVAVGIGIFYAVTSGFGLKESQTEWQKSWYNKRKVKHGKK